MEFKLNDYHHNISDQEFLDDIKRVANLLNTQFLSKESYKKIGKYSPSTIEKHFGSWSKALSIIGLYPGNTCKNINNIRVSDEDLLDDLKQTASSLGVSTITTTQYEEFGKHGCFIILGRFKKWETALIRAGLEPTGYRSFVSKEELLEDIEKTWVRLGRQPTTTDIKNGASKFSLNSFVRKFGSWRKALEYFVDYINLEEQHTENNNTSTETTCVSDCINSKTTKNEPLNERKTKRDINLRLRFLVMKRDNFKCCICGRSPATSPGLELHIDHIKPWSKGGETVIENLQTLCQDCNLGKSNLE